MDEQPNKFWKDDKQAPVPPPEPKKPPKINIDGEKIRNGLGQLILTVVELLRELMEKQAIRRIEAGVLSDEQVERLGNTFMQLKEEVNRLKGHFQLEDKDLNLALGPITLRDTNEWEGKASAVEILDRLLGTGVVVRGDIVVSVAEVDLLSLHLGLILASIDKAKTLYAAPATAVLEAEVARLRAENAQLRLQ